MLSHDEFRQQKGDFEMKKEQNRYSLHLIRQNVPQFILLVIFSVLLGVSVIAVSVLMKMFLDIATNASAMPLTTCLIIAVGVWWSTSTAQTLGRSTAAQRITTSRA